MDERRLRKYFHFTENDLEANRLGRFSENQKKRLLEEARAEQKSARESAIILFVVAAVGLAFGSILASVAPSLLGRIFFIGVLCVLWPAAWVGKGLQILRAARKLQEPLLLSVRGPVHMVKHDDETYVLNVGEIEFDLEDSASGVIIEGDEYTIFYLESSQEIISVEVP